MRRVLLLSALTLMLCGCTGLFFQPWGPHVRTPTDIGLAYEDVWFRTEDGVPLHGWFLPVTGQSCATILFLHGNAENISTHIGSVYWLPARGFSVFMPDYRGYGASAGKPSLPAVQQDAEAAIRYLLSRPGAERQPLVVYGQSLGGAVAIYYTATSAHRDRIRALVAESAFASYRDIAREKLGSFWLTWPLQWPLAWTIADDYSPIQVVAQVAPIPLLLVHGDRDTIIPWEHSKRLYDAAREPKEFWLVEGAGHIEAFRSEPMRERLMSYLRARACPEQNKQAPR